MYFLLACASAFAGLVLGFGFGALWPLKVVASALMGLALVAVLRAMGPNTPSPPEWTRDWMAERGYEARPRTAADEFAVFCIAASFAGLSFFGLA